MGSTVDGALSQAKARDKHDLQNYGRKFQNASVHKVLRLLHEPVIEAYVDLFLERNFYRQICGGPRKLDQ